MKLEPIDTGFAIDATDLGRLFDRPPAEVQRLMRDGAITSRFERGEGEDAGRSRVTFFDGDRRVRLTVADNGEVLKRSRGVLRHQRQDQTERAPRPSRGTPMTQVDEKLEPILDEVLRRNAGEAVRKVLESVGVSVGTRSQ